MIESAKESARESARESAKESASDLAIIRCKSQKSNVRAWIGFQIFPIQNSNTNGKKVTRLLLAILQVQAEAFLKRLARFGGLLLISININYVSY